MDTKAELKGLVEADMQDVVEEVVEHKAKPKEVVQKKDLVGAAVVEWVDSKKLTFVRSGPQGFEEVKLEAGDSGFCIARLGDKIVETEVPNLLLAPLAPVLRPAACKRPAAAMAEDKAEVEDNNLDEDDGDDKSDHGRSLLALTIAPQPFGSKQSLRVSPSLTIAPQPVGPEDGA